jgi:hypothetical protein
MGKGFPRQYLSGRMIKHDQNGTALAPIPQDSARLRRAFGALALLRGLGTTSP